jgi:hypothetical protein
MRSDGWGLPTDVPTPTSGPDRRTFLSLGVGCVIPLLVGEATAKAAEGLAARQVQGMTDPVMDHIHREVMRAYRGMRGSGGIRGEHVRALGANVVLLGAHLQGSKEDARLDAFLRRRIRDKGREATAQELSATYRELAAGLSAQQGVTSRVELEDTATRAALDVLVAHGAVETLRRYEVGLQKLAAGIDSAMMTRGARPIPVAVRQKPGDDFLGYPAPDGSGCAFLEGAIHGLTLEAAIFGLMGLAAAVFALAVVAEALELVKFALCQQTNVP